MKTDSIFQFKSETTPSIIAGVLSGALFLVFHYVLEFPQRMFPGDFMLSLGLAALSFAGLYLLLPHPVLLKDRLTKIAEKAGIDPEKLADHIETSRAKIQTIRNINQEIPGYAHRRIEKIANNADKIIDGIMEDPEDMDRSYNFLYQYLGATVDIVRQYAELHQKKSAKNVRQVLKKADETLSEIEYVFEQQYLRNLDNEAQSLDVNLEVLRRTMIDEGL